MIEEADDEEGRGGSSPLDGRDQGRRRRRRILLSSIAAIEEENKADGGQSSSSFLDRCNRGSIEEGYDEEGRCGSFSSINVIEEKDDREREEDPPSQSAASSTAATAVGTEDGKCSATSAHGITATMDVAVKAVG